MTGAESIHLPLYFALDVSNRMSGAPLDDLGHSVRDGISAFARHAPGDCRVWVSVITYADDAFVLLPLQDADGVERLPQLAAGGGIRLGPLLETLRDRIIADVAVMAKGTDMASHFAELAPHLVDVSLTEDLHAKPRARSAGFTPLPPLPR